VLHCGFFFSNLLISFTCAAWFILSILYSGLIVCAVILIYYDRKTLFCGWKIVTDKIKTRPHTSPVHTPPVTRSHTTPLSLALSLSGDNLTSESLCHMPPRISHGGCSGGGGCAPYSSWIYFLGFQWALLLSSLSLGGIEGASRGRNVGQTMGMTSWRFREASGGNGD